MTDNSEIATFPRGAKRPAAIDELAAAIETDGGAALAAYQEPIGAHWQIFALVPAAMLQGTPFQRDLSPAHLKRLGEVMKKLHRKTESRDLRKLARAEENALPVRLSMFGIGPTGSVPHKIYVGALGKKALG